MAAIEERHSRYVRRASLRAIGLAAFAVIALVIYAAWVTGGFRQWSSWHDFGNWAHEDQRP